MTESGRPCSRPSRSKLFGDQQSPLSMLLTKVPSTDESSNVMLGIVILVAVEWRLRASEAIARLTETGSNLLRCSSAWGKGEDGGARGGGGEVDLFFMGGMSVFKERDVAFESAHGRFEDVGPDIVSTLGGTSAHRGTELERE